MNNSKKMLIDLFLMSDVSTYRRNFPTDTHDEPSVDNFKNRDFTINRNLILFLTVEAACGRFCFLKPKIIMYLIIGFVFTAFCTAALYSSESPDYVNYFIIIGIFHGSYILAYIYFYIKNFKMIRKYREIKREIRNRSKRIDENSQKKVADDIIAKNPQLLRKMKLEKLKINNDENNK